MFMLIYDSVVNFTKYYQKQNGALQMKLQHLKSQNKQESFNLTQLKLWQLPVTNCTIKDCLLSFKYRKWGKSNFGSKYSISIAE